MRVEAGDSGFIPQPGVLAEIPSHARYLTFRRRASSPGPRDALERLADPHPGLPLVFGLGASLVRELGAEVPGLRDFPASSGPGFTVPSTPAALWVWLRSEERGELVHETRRVEKALAGTFALEDVLDAFRYRTGLDLTGYEDGTENPKGDAAVEAAVVSGGGPGLDGSSFAAVQTVGPRPRPLRVLLVPDAGPHHRTPQERQRGTQGRAGRGPRTTHRTGSSRPARLPAPPLHAVGGRAAGGPRVRRLRPNSLDAFEYHLSRMTGATDRIADHLFRFTRPVTGAYFWCPPIRGGRADLSLLG